MLLVISPAKNLDYETPATTKQSTTPDFLDQAQLLIEELRGLAPQDVSQLMSISDKLGVLNYDRFQQWSLPFSADNAKQAALAFNGDVYTGLNAESFKADDFKFLVIDKASCDIGIFETSDDFIARGEEKFFAAVENYKYFFQGDTDLDQYVMRGIL